MTYYDRELVVQEHKEASQKAAESYMLMHQIRSQPTVRVRLLAYVGGALVSAGYRLQARYEYLTVTAVEGHDTLHFSSNGAGSTNCQ